MDIIGSTCQETGMHHAFASYIPKWEKKYVLNYLLEVERRQKDNISTKKKLEGKKRRQR